jgi:hypothetical protein
MGLRISKKIFQKVLGGGSVCPGNLASSLERACGNTGKRIDFGRGGDVKSALGGRN